MRITAEGGSLGLRRGSLVAAGTLPRDIEYTVAAAVVDAVGGDLYFPEFDTGSGSPDDGWALEQDFTEVSALRTSISWAGLTLRGEGSRFGKGDPTAPYGTVLNAGARRDVDRNAVSLEYEREVSTNAAFEARVRWDDADVDAYLPNGAPVPPTRLGLGGDRWGGEAQLRYDFSARNRLVVGGEVTRIDGFYRIAAELPGTSVVVISNDLRIDLASAYLQDEWHVTPAFTLTFGGRVDHYSTAGTAFSPRGALVFRAADATALKLLYGEAFRAPSVLEETAEDPDVFQRNPDLGAERIRTLEFVLDQRLSDNLHLQVSAFDYRMRDLIGQAFDVVTGKIEYRNIDRVRGRGVSAEMVGRFNGTSVFLSGIFQRAEDHQTGIDLPNSPETLLRAGIGTRLPAGFRASLRAAYDGERALLQGGTVDGYTLVHASLSSPAFGPFQALFTVQNLFDEAYLHPTGIEHRQLGMPQDGRALRVSVSARF
jgi:iron complex outermembrane receptor protein